MQHSDSTDIDSKSQQTLLRDIVRRQCPSTIKVVAEACHYFRSIFPHSKEKKLDSLIKRYGQIVVYASGLIVNNLSSAEKPSSAQPVKADKSPRAYGNRDQKHTWRAGNGLLKTLRETANSLFNEVEILERLILSPTKEDKEIMFSPGREPLNYRPENFVHFFEDLLNQIELIIKDSATIIKLDEGRKRGAVHRGEFARSERNKPESTLSQVLRLANKLKQEGKPKHNWASIIANDINKSDHYVRKLLKNFPNS